MCENVAFRKQNLPMMDTGVFTFELKAQSSPAQCSPPDMIHDENYTSGVPQNY